jgi:hypothetical protein
VQGLFVQKQLVEFAEKQRTLSKKKIIYSVHSKGRELPFSKTKEEFNS